MISLGDVGGGLAKMVVVLRGRLAHESGIKERYPYVLSRLDLQRSVPKKSFISPVKNCVEKGRFTI